MLGGDVLRARVRTEDDAQHTAIVATGREDQLCTPASGSERGIMSKQHGPRTEARREGGVALGQGVMGLSILLASLTGQRSAP